MSGGRAKKVGKRRLICLARCASFHSAEPLPVVAFIVQTAFASGRPVVAFMVQSAFANALMMSPAWSAKTQLGSFFFLPELGAIAPPFASKKRTVEALSGTLTRKKAIESVRKTQCPF
jgi:hypothetical protein